MAAAPPENTPPLPDWLVPVTPAPLSLRPLTPLPVPLPPAMPSPLPVAPTGLSGWPPRSGSRLTPTTPGFPT
jgi:hypothetical protein